MIIGTQLFGFKDEFNKDLQGTIREIRKLGYDLIEPILMLKEEQGEHPKNEWAADTLALAMEAVKETGLQMVSAHIQLKPEDRPEDVAPWLMRFYGKGFRYFIFSGMFGDEENSAAFGRRIRLIREEALKAGLPAEVRFLYHNHGMEFTRLSAEKFALDAVLSKAGEDFQLELDFGWADYAGVSLEELRKYYDRVRIVHLKDFNLGTRDISTLENRAEIFAAIGEGTCPIRETLHLLGDLKNWDGILILDQDYAEYGMLKAMETGLRNVKRMLKE